MKTEKEMREYAKASAAYWLDCSEHEQTPEDAKILARYARLAIDRIVELEAAELRAAQAGTPIEKAAREAAWWAVQVLGDFGKLLEQDLRKLGDHRMIHVKGLKRAAEAAERLRASLSSLPQDGADGDREPLPSVGEPKTAREDKGEISDGYHTFNELYEHRHALFAVACCFLGGWKSKLHEDGTMFPGWFIAGLSTIDGPATYHLPMHLWDRFPGREVKRAPAWDGHTAADVVARLWAHVANTMSGGEWGTKALSDLLNEIKAERSDAPEGLPEGPNPSNSNVTQEGAPGTQEGGRT